VFYRRYDRPLPRAVRATGCWIEDAEGKRYLDAAGGALVANLGHGDAEIAAEVAAAVAEVGYLNGTQFTHRFVEELAERLLSHLPAPLAHAYFLASGSEAIEAAVKLARQVWVERGRSEKWLVIHRVPSYHGNTLAALSLSAREHYRRIFGPLLHDFPRVPAPDPYRDPGGPGSTGEALEAAILAAGPERVAAFLYEPIGGSASGAVVPLLDGHRRVVEICRRHDVLLIADEVLCGMGRTGRWLASEHLAPGSPPDPALMPDVVVLGKGLNGGYAPLSALVVTADILATIRRGSGAFNHAQTYSHSPTITAAGLATVRRLERDHLVEQVAAREATFFRALAPLADHPLVGDVRGRGFLAAVELVADRAGKRPFARTARVAERLTAHAFDAGLVVWPNVGHVVGEGDLVMLGPPFVASDDELAEMARRLLAALDRLAAELAAETPAWSTLARNDGASGGRV
jgi:adenosylmethionine-8-amino-7-oxononanoate aminotransferase